LTVGVDSSYCKIIPLSTLSNLNFWKNDLSYIENITWKNVILTFSSSNKCKHLYTSRIGYKPIIYPINKNKSMDVNLNPLTMYFRYLYFVFLNVCSVCLPVHAGCVFPQSV
jgi:hypothetical protein